MLTLQERIDATYLELSRNEDEARGQDLWNGLLKLLAEKYKTKLMEDAINGETTDQG